MATKTITITEGAYESLRNLKETRESFSETIIRIARRRPLSEFYGVIGKESGKKLENVIIELRKKRNLSHQARIKNIVESLK